MSVDSTSIQIGSIIIEHPVAAGTNALLAIQCTAYFFSLRASPQHRVRLWGGFFIMMALATLAGVFKHGVPHLLGEDGFFIVLAASNLGGGVSTYFAQRATVTFCASSSTRAAWRILISMQLAALMIANVILGPQLILLIINTAVGLLPVIANEALHGRTVRGATRVAVGLSIATFTGVVYLTGVSFGAWFNHVDIAHVIMLLSFHVIYQGVRHSGDFTWN